MQGNYIGFAFHIVLPVMITIADWLPASLLSLSSPYQTLWVFHEPLRTCSSPLCSLDMYGPHGHMHTSHTCTHSHHTCKHIKTHTQTAPMHTSHHTHTNYTHTQHIHIYKHTHFTHTYPPPTHTSGIYLLWCSYLGIGKVFLYCYKGLI